MSVILAVCGAEFCAMASDGRMVEEPLPAEPGAKPKIVTEKLPKLRKLNASVCVGFAGDTLAAVRIVNAVDEYQVQYLTLEKTIRILCEKARTVSCGAVGVRLMVGGRNRKGLFQLTSLGSAQNYEPQTQLAREGSMLIEGACSHTEIAPFLQRELKEKAVSWRSVDEIGLAMGACICAVAAQDATVNTEIYRQLVR